jgi:two-component sensor histidine kinase
MGRFAARFVQILSWSSRLPAIVKWLAALSMFMVGLVARSMLGPLHGASPSLTFYPVILVAAVLLGWKEGLFLLALAVALAAYLYVPPGMYILPVGWMFIGTLTIGIITGLKSLAEQLAAANERQRILFQELQHRVANTLQSVVGVIEVARRRIGSAPEEAIRLLDETAGRLTASADVHRRLNDPHLFRRGLEAILRDAVATVVDRDDVWLSFNVAELDLTFDQMSAITMLVIEAANNSQKHVFQQGLGSHLTVVLEPLSEHRGLLMVRDDGPGSASVVDAGSTEQRLGMHIVQGLVAQLHGTLRIESTSGTEIAVEFPLAR